MRNGHKSPASDAPVKTQTDLLSSLTQYLGQQPWWVCAQNHYYMTVSLTRPRGAGVYEHAPKAGAPAAYVRITSKQFNHTVVDSWISFDMIELVVLCNLLGIPTSESHLGEASSSPSVNLTFPMYGANATVFSTILGPMLRQLHLRMVSWEARPCDAYLQIPGHERLSLIPFDQTSFEQILGNPLLLEGGTIECLISRASVPALVNLMQTCFIAILRSIEASRQPASQLWQDIAIAPRPTVAQDGDDDDSLTTLSTSPSA